MSIFCNSFFLGVLRDAAVIDAMRWHGDCDTVFHVINRSSGEATKVVYTSESFFFLHTINAYEEVGSTTGCDLLAQKKIEAFLKFIDRIVLILIYYLVFHAK